MTAEKLTVQANMAPPEVLAMRDLMPDIRAIVCDIWGVVHNGVHPFQSAVDALIRARAAGVPVALVTNAPVPRAKVIAFMNELRVSPDCYDAVVSSGDVMRAMLARYAPGPVYYIGAVAGFDHDRTLWADMDLQFTNDPAKATFVLSVALRHQERETPEDYRPELKDLVARGLPMLCANPDRVVRLGDVLYPCAGALADIYLEEGGVVHSAGKPFPPIYELAMQELAALGLPEVRPDQVLAIGDGPQTDMPGANAMGYRALFISDGINVASGLDAKAAAHAALRKADARAHAMMPILTW